MASSHFIGDTAISQVEIIVDPAGIARHLVDPLSESIAAGIGPKIDTVRASRVESWSSLSSEAQAWIREHRSWIMTAMTGIDPNVFWADMLPVGPVLGPFSKYEQAIDAEIRWLQQHNLPMPKARDGATATGSAAVA